MMYLLDMYIIWLFYYYRNIKYKMLWKIQTKFCNKERIIGQTSLKDLYKWPLMMYK